jgi:ABC-2 type transport system ATP-binding protein
MLPEGAAERIPELARLVALSERLDEKVSTYSLGMRQRLGIAQALLGNPDILILDEPANGLDPAGIREIRQLMRHLASERGIAVFVSSHLLSEVEQTCDRVAIIHRGRTLAAGPVRELVDRVASDRLRLIARPVKRAAEILAPFGAAEIAADDRGADEGAIDARIPKERVPDALRALTAAGVDVFAVERSLASLEEVFLEVTGGETV